MKRKFFDWERLNLNPRLRSARLSYTFKRLVTYGLAVMIPFGMLFVGGYGMWYVGNTLLGVIGIGDIAPEHSDVQVVVLSMESSLDAQYASDIAAEIQSRIRDAQSAQSWVRVVWRLLAPFGMLLAAILGIGFLAILFLNHEIRRLYDRVYTFIENKPIAGKLLQIGKQIGDAIHGDGENAAAGNEASIARRGDGMSGVYVLYVITGKTGEFFSVLRPCSPMPTQSFPEFVHESLFLCDENGERLVVSMDIAVQYIASGGFVRPPELEQLLVAAALDRKRRSGLMGDGGTEG